jgi:hypothetical protein
VRYNRSSYLNDLAQKADFARQYATNLPEYQEALFAFGIRVRMTEKNITYFYPGRDKGKRGSKLGKNYDKEGIDTALRKNRELYQGRPELRAAMSDLLQQARMGKSVAPGALNVAYNRSERERTPQRVSGKSGQYPKGKRQHSHRVPRELITKLENLRRTATTDLVAAPPGWKMLDYSKYRRVLQRFCEDSGVRPIATHGLRHSSSEVWMEAGASRDDLRILFAHQDSKTTDRYVHDRGNRLSKVADVLLLFPGKSNQDFPRNFHGEENFGQKKIAKEVFPCDVEGLQNRGGGN